MTDYVAPEKMAHAWLGSGIGGGSLDTSWFDRYVSAWLLHPVAGSPEGKGELKALLDCCSPNVRYEDVPTGMIYEGYEGLTRMCEGAYKWSSDIEPAVVTRQTNGPLFAIETLWRGTNTTAIGDLPASGRRFTLRTLSVGSIDDQGLVTEHRDYWDRAGFLAQIGAGPERR